MIEKDGIGSTRRKALIDQQIIGHPKNPDYLLYHNELLEFFRVCSTTAKGNFHNRAHFAPGFWRKNQARTSPDTARSHRTE
jgi:hypothetical protein